MYRSACHRQKRRLKHKPQHAAQNPQAEAQKKKHQHFNYHIWELTI